jgi:hypothetical protein
LIEERARSAIEDDLRAPCFSEPIVGERFWSGFGGFDGVCRLGVWKILLTLCFDTYGLHRKRRRYYISYMRRHFVWLSPLTSVA